MNALAMQSSKPFVVLFLLALIGGAVVWFTRFAADDVVVPAAATGGAAAATDAPGGPETGPGPVAGGEANGATRVAAPAPAGAGGVAAANASGLRGQVLDDQGQPVAGALVRCSAGFGEGLGFENFDLADLEDFDQQAMLERLRNAQRQRQEATTDAEGRFRIAAVGTGRSVSLRVVARQFVVLDRNVPRPTEADTDLGVLTLKRGAVVSGRVVDRAGNGLAEARVRRPDRGQGGGGFGGFDMGDFEMPGAAEFEGLVGDEQATTDAEGRFELPHCAPGEFSLRARHPDHPLARLDGLSVAAGAQLADVLVVVEPGAVIRGRIVGAPEGQKPLRVMASQRRDAAAQIPGAGDGNPFGALLGDAADMAADAGFGFGEKQVDCAADQTFELRGLQVGKAYRVWAVQNGRGIAGNAICTQRLEVDAGTLGVELRYDAGIAVTFQVVDKRTGAPVERLWVRDQLRGGGGLEDMMAFLPRGGRAKTYAEGRVTVANLRPKNKQSLTLGVESIGYASFERKDIPLPTTGALDLGVIQLEPAPVLQVTVTTGSARTPVAGATVRLTEADRGGRRNRGIRGGDPMEMIGEFAPGFAGPGGGGPRTGKTDAEGRCVLNAFAAAMVVNVTAKDFAPYASSPIEVPQGAAGSHDAALLRGGAVEVAVVDGDGKPLAGLRIDHVRPAGERDNQQTDKQGLAVFEHLVPGAHKFRLARRGGGAAEVAQFRARMLGDQGQAPAADEGWDVVQVDDGARATLRLTKAPTASLRGIVRENGVPLAGARVTFAEGVEDRGAGGALEQQMGEMIGEFGNGGRSGRSARTGQDGSYQFTELPEGAHRLRISTRERVMPSVVQVSLRFGENVVDVELDVTGVRGTVVDSAGAPIVGATVSIVPVRAAAQPADPRARAIEEAMGGMDVEQLMGGGGRGQVRTGADGRYELRGVQPGKPVQVKATAKGYSAAMSPVVELTAGGLREGLDIVLGTAGKVRISIGNAPQFARARATKVTADGAPDPGVPTESLFLRNGKGTMDGLRPGRWRIEVLGMDGRAGEPQFVEITAGETAEMRI
jgi:protocatechuate 3,4-dioxygenase beta subunit